MQWRKAGIIYQPNGLRGWAVSHAMVPTPYRLSHDVIRLYITCCDKHGIGRTGFIDLSAENPLNILNISEGPVLDVGRPGTFDENGVLCCSVVRTSPEKIYMYYAGFELGQKIRYRLLTGLAVSDDGGNTFRRYQESPILERSSEELFFRGGPFCLLDEGVYKLWYVAGGSWETINGKEMPVYEVKYMESLDGISWPSFGKKVLPISKTDEHGFGRPFVVKNANTSKYEIFYSVRRRSLLNYRLGYAISNDGINWNRLDEDLNLDVSKVGFDSQAIMYLATIEVNEVVYGFYNGNNFGEDGVGLAILESR